MVIDPAAPWPPKGGRARASSAWSSACSSAIAACRYGFGAGSALGVATPYAGLTLGDGGGRTWRTGARWAIAPGAALSLEATRSESVGDAEPVGGVQLRGLFRW